MKPLPKAIFYRLTTDILSQFRIKDSAGIITYKPGNAKDIGTMHPPSRHPDVTDSIYSFNIIPVIILILDVAFDNRMEVRTFGIGQFFSDPCRAAHHQGPWRYLCARRKQGTGGHQG